MQDIGLVKAPSGALPSFKIVCLSKEALWCKILVLSIPAVSRVQISIL